MTCKNCKKKMKEKETESKFILHYICECGFEVMEWKEK